MAGKARVFVFCKYFAIILKVLGAQLGVRLAGTNTLAYYQTAIRRKNSLQHQPRLLLHLATGLKNCLSHHLPQNSKYSTNQNLNFLSEISVSSNSHSANEREGKSDSNEFI
jgi:hypothetical protein